MPIVYRNVKGTKLTIAEVDGNFSQLVSDIAAETSRATAAENTLTNNLNSEISTRAAADATLTNNLNAEISTARAAETTLTGDLNAEISRATTAEAANASAISAEAVTARAAEVANANNIAAEIVRATNAENANAAAINALPDSAQVLGLIDSAHIQARQITYSTDDFVDSAFVTAKIDALINGAPGTLDTLNEIAAALNDDDSAYNTLIGLIAAKTDFDSANATSLIDSAYVTARAPAGGDVNQNAWAEIQVAGQTNVVADAHSDILSFVAGNNMTITTDGPTDTVTFNATAGGVDSAYVTTAIIGQVDTNYVQARAPTSYIQSKITDVYIQNAIDSDFVLSKTGTILDSADTINLIDSALPIGQLGQQYFVSTNNTNKLETDYLLTVNNKYVETASELAEEIADVTTLQEVFNTWNRFSHSSSGFVYPANASEMNSWVYNSGPGTISQPLNTGTATGFYSSDTYEDYTHTARFTSTQTDNDIGFMVIGFVVEGSGATYRQHTLSAVRQTDGGIGGIASWDLVYNIGQSDQAILTSATNGGSGPANAATSTGGWDTHTSGTLIFTEKTGRNITIRTSYFSSSNLALNSATDMNFDLLSDSRTVRFAGAVPYGYGAWSQGGLTISEISFIPGQSELLYHFGGTLSGNAGGDVYAYSSDSSAWNLDSDLSLQDAQGKILHNNKTGRTYYVDGTQAHSIGSVRQFNDVVYLLPQNSEPDSADTGGLGLRAGMFATADGVSWDPASKGTGTPYPVFFNGTSWVALY